MMHPESQLSTRPGKVKTRIRLFLQKLWRWFIEPSSEITQPDRRRQAALLTGFLLGVIVLAILVEVISDLLVGWAAYATYRQTIVLVICVGVVYFISRTSHLQLAAALGVVFITLGVFVSGWGESRDTLGSLFDFLILPLWLGSLFIDLKRLPFLIAGVLAGLLVFPFFSYGITLNDILIGPFTFNLVTSILLLIITRHRDRLEQDRQAELSAKEESSRREAARADALLRVAGRLNAQLDTEAVLDAIGEEVSRAMRTSISVVTLYDRGKDHLYVAGGVGLSDEQIQSLPPIPRKVYDEMVRDLGVVFYLPDLQSSPSLSFLVPIHPENIRSIAFASMEYEHELIGSLSAITVGNQHVFSKDETLLLRGIADQAALALVNTRLFKDASRRLDHLQALRTIDIAIASNRDLQNNLDVLLTKITEQLKVDAAVFLLLTENGQYLEFATSLGFNTPMLRFTRLRLGEGIAGYAAMQRKIIHIQDLRVDPQTLAYAPSLAKEGFVSYYAAPLIAQGQIKGVLEIFHRSRLSPDKEWQNFLEALADQAAIAIESTTLYEDLLSANEDLISAYDTTIEGWSHALDLRDKETEGHTQRVTEMTLKLARAMNLSEDELVHIRRGALLHDIGKMGVPDHILLKPGILTPEEWLIMRKHPIYAHELLSPIAYLRPALDIPYCHHEKWDGTGYPRGLKEEKIPFAARLFALVDVWDALRSDRPYRASWPKEKVIEYISSQAGSHFDPGVTDIFLNLLNE